MDTRMADDKLCGTHPLRHHCSDVSLLITLPDEKLLSSSKHTPFPRMSSFLITLPDEKLLSSSKHTPFPRMSSFQSRRNIKTSTSHSEVHGITFQHDVAKKNTRIIRPYEGACDFVQIANLRHLPSTPWVYCCLRSVPSSNLHLGFFTQPLVCEAVHSISFYHMVRLFV